MTPKIRPSAYLLPYQSLSFYFIGYGQKLRIFLNPHLFDAPAERSRWNCVTVLWLQKKLEWGGYLAEETFGETFSRLDTIHECESETDRDSRWRLASRGNIETENPPQHVLPRRFCLQYVKGL